MKVGEIVCFLTGFRFRPTNYAEIEYQYPRPCKSTTVIPSEYCRFRPGLKLPRSFPPNNRVVPDHWHPDDSLSEMEAYFVCVLKSYMEYCWLNASFYAVYQNPKWCDVWYGLFLDVFRQAAELDERSTRLFVDAMVQRFKFQ
jgi:hypothetical protein